MNKKVIDLTRTLKDKMSVYPGDIGISVTQDKFFEHDKYNNFELKTGLHTGTHIDTPMHLGKSNQFISEYSMDKFIGKGIILDVRNEKIIKMKKEYQEIVHQNSIVLFFTGYDAHFGSNEYYENHPCIDIELCNFLLYKKVKMIGLDTPSPDKYPFEIHNMLFNEGILIIENLINMHELLGLENFDIFALPLKIEADSSPARVIAILKD